MANIPSIKGSVLRGLIAQANELMQDKKALRSELEERLDENGIKIFDEAVQPVLFYPLRFYIDLSEFICEIGYGGLSEGYRKMGERAANDLSALAIYRQIGPDRERFGPEVTKYTAGLGNAVFNFGRWTGERISYCEETGETVSQIRVEGGEPFPDWYRESMAGFMHRLISTRPEVKTVNVTSERPTPGKIIWTNKSTRTRRL